MSHRRRAILACGILLAFFTAPTLFAADAHKDPEYHLRAGKIEHSAGRIQEAIKHLRKYVNMNPGSAEGQNRLGLALDEDKQEGWALRNLQKAYQLEPSNAGYAMDFASRAYLHHWNQQALEPAKKYAELKPQDEFAFLLLHRVAYKNNDYTLAVQAYERMEEIRDMRKYAGVMVEELGASTYNNVGISYAVIGDYERAREFLHGGWITYMDTASVTEWFYVFSYCSRGWENARRSWRALPGTAGKTDESLKIMIEAGIRDIAVKAENAGMKYLSLRHYSLLFSFISKKTRGASSKEERKLLDKIFSIYKKLPLKPKPPRDAILHALKAEKHIAKKKWIEVVDSYNEAIALAPWWPDPHYNMALAMYVDFGAHPGAVRELDKYLVLAPNGPNAAKAREKKRQWEAVIQEDVARGATIVENFPYLITPDREDW